MKWTIFSVHLKTVTLMQRQHNQGFIQKGLKGNRKNLIILSLYQGCDITFWNGCIKKTRYIYLYKCIMIKFYLFLMSIRQWMM